MSEFSESTESGIARLDGECLLEFKGPDAARVLQGQTTADFANKDIGEVLCGAFCDLKGRVICDFLALIKDADTILMRVSADLAGPLSEHLKKFLMFSKTSLSPSDYRVMGVIGDEAHGPVALAIRDSTELRAIPLENGFSIPRGPGQSELFLKKSADLSSSAELPPEAWYASALARGEARVSDAISGKYLPQDLSYDLAGWINFKKGCYTGQEIIARLHWRGTPKRRLYLAEFPGSDAPTPGDAVHLEGESKVVGSVVNAVCHNERVAVAIEATTAVLEYSVTLPGARAPLSVRVAFA